MSDAGTLLLTGAGGQLGVALQRCPLPSGWTLVPFDRAALDLRDRRMIEEVLDAAPWSAVINAAAYTAVDRAEDDADEAWRVNATGPATLGAACARRGVPVVHVSTDYVFSGRKVGAWAVDDAAQPINVYGKTKRAGEIALRAAGVHHAIVRTSWLYAPRGANFVTTMLRLAATQDIVRVVDDQFGRPTAASELADFLLMLAIRLVEKPHLVTGTFHFANAGVASWADFATELFRQSALRGGPTAQVEPIASSLYASPALRPTNSVLDLSRLHEAFCIEPRHWKAALSDTLDEWIGDIDERHRLGRRHRHAAASRNLGDQQATAPHL